MIILDLWYFGGEDIHIWITNKLKLVMLYLWMLHGSSVSFGSRISSKCIGHNKFIGRRSNLSSKPTPIYWPVNKSEFYFSYSQSHFIWSPQTFSKGIINSLSQKYSYAYMMINTVLNWFITNQVRSHLRVFDHSMVTFGKIGSCLGFSNTSHVES